MHLNVPPSLITFNPASKTITLGSPFNLINEKDILRIRDETTKEIIYDRGIASTKITITIANEIITYTYDNDHQNASDDIQVELDFGYYAPRVAVWSNQAVAVGATVNQSSKLYVEGAATIWLIASESGASGVTFNVLSFETSNSSASSVIQTGSISSISPTPIIVEVGLPYIALQAINQDGSNAASITASLIITWR